MIFWFSDFVIRTIFCQMCWIMKICRWNWVEKSFVFSFAQKTNPIFPNDKFRLNIFKPSTMSYRWTWRRLTLDKQYTHHIVCICVIRLFSIQLEWNFDVKLVLLLPIEWVLCRFVWRSERFGWNGVRLDAQFYCQAKTKKFTLNKSIFYR